MGRGRARYRPGHPSSPTLTALTLQAEAGAPPLALVAADASIWRSILTEQVFRQEIIQCLGIEPSQFIFSLSHSHSAPPLAEPDPTWTGGELLRAHLQNVQQSAVKTVKHAVATARQATLEWVTGRCGLAANRDLPDPAKNRMVCGFNPRGATDDTLLVGRVTELTGTTMATIVNYACHPTTLAWENELISPDFVGAMRETIAANTGSSPVVFLQGASGELAPRFQYVGDAAVADRHGHQLAFAALAALTGMEPPDTELAYNGVVESGTALGVWKRIPHTAPATLQAVARTVELPLKEWPSAEELERQRLACTDRTLEERFRRQRDIRRVLGDGKTFAMPFWIWRAGDIFLLGCMAESYAWMQQHLRRRFPDRAIVYMNLINGSIGYLPPENLYSSNLYQVSQTPFERGSLEILAKAFEETIMSLR